MLTLSPLTISNFLKISKTKSTLLDPPVRNRDVSSAYCEIVWFSLSIFTPFTSGSFLIFIANNSIASINRYGESGQPCRTPRVTLKDPEAQPLLIIHDEVLE